MQFGRAPDDALPLPFGRRQHCIGARCDGLCVGIVATGNR
jgi:hypothetical protein